MLLLLLCVIAQVEAHGLAADAYNMALNGCHVATQRVHDKFARKLDEMDVRASQLNAMILLATGFDSYCICIL